jgi:hypothetical protein
MAVTINGDGTIIGVSVGGLPDGVVDSGTLATGIDATKLADGTITNSELQYINSLSSNAQTQISAAGPTDIYNKIVTRVLGTTGTQAITGVGFAPKGYIVWGAISGGTTSFFGTGINGVGEILMFDNNVQSAGTWACTSGASIIGRSSLGNQQYCNASAYGVDGITINWQAVTGGSLTGTLTMHFFFYR